MEQWEILATMLHINPYIIELQVRLCLVRPAETEHASTFQRVLCQFHCIVMSFSFEKTTLPWLERKIGSLILYAFPPFYLAYLFMKFSSSCLCLGVIHEVPGDF